MQMLNPHIRMDACFDLGARHLADVTAVPTEDAHIAVIKQMLDLGRP